MVKVANAESQKSIWWCWRRLNCYETQIQCMYIHMYICMYIYTCLYLCIFLHIYIHIYMYVHIFIYTHMYICVYVCTILFWENKWQLSRFSDILLAWNKKQGTASTTETRSSSSFSGWSATTGGLVVNSIMYAVRIVYWVISSVHQYIYIYMYIAHHSTCFFYLPIWIYTRIFSWSAFVSRYTCDGVHFRLDHSEIRWHHPRI